MILFRTQIHFLFSSDPLSPNIFLFEVPQRYLNLEFINEESHLHVHGSLTLVNGYMTCR